MLKKNNTLIIWIVIGVLLFFSAVGGFIYFYNLTSEATAIRQQKEGELKIVIAKIENLPKLKEQVAALEAEEIRLAEFIPSKEGQAEFVWALQDLADQSDIEITSCKIEKGSRQYKDIPGYQVYQWKVSVSGNYQGLIRFLEILPEAKRSVMVSNLKVSSVTEGDDVKDNYILKTDMMLDLITAAGEKTSSGEKVKQP